MYTTSCRSLAGIDAIAVRIAIDAMAVRLAIDAIAARLARLATGRRAALPAGVEPHSARRS
ncbi:MAG: hypothetical protein ACYCU0_01980 [Solirubrobacteraceae bacterium]